MATIVSDDASKVIWGTNDAAGDAIYGLGGDDTIEAGDGGDRLYGGLGNDKLYGQGGDDILDGWNTGQGDDLLDGGSGYDTADYSGDPTAVIVSLSKGYAKGAGIGNDTLAGIDNVIGGEGGDNIHGDDPGFLGIGGLGANILDGRGGDDFLNGWGGNDTLFGGKGMDVLLGGKGDDMLFGQADNDRLKGEAGNDTLDGGDGIDTADYSGATSAVRMYVDAAWGGSEGTDVLVNMENITGSQYDDILGFNDLWGGGGNINYNTAHRIEGGGGNDDIEGGYFNDTLLGGDGDDVLRGDQGVDVLTGGGGSDKFQFWAATVGTVTGVDAGNRDYVTDFQPGVDKLAFLGDPNGGPVLGPLSFIGEAAFTQSGQIRASYYGSDTILQGNTDTDGAPEFEIQLSGHLTLSANDFLF